MPCISPVFKHFCFSLPIAVIPEAPPTPPSDSTNSEEKTVASRTSLLVSFLTAFKNFYFVAFVFVYGKPVVRVPYLIRNTDSVWPSGQYLYSYCFFPIQQCTTF